MSNFRGPGINPTVGTPRVAGWNATALEIAAAREELNKYAGIMTPYERMVIGNSIKEKIESSYQMVYAGAKNHLAVWIGYYKDAIARYERAQRNETNNWDSGKLLTETNAFQARLERELGNKNGLPLYEGAPDSLERVKRLYHEAQASGDKYKQRAAAEVMRSISTEGMKQSAAVDLRVLAREADASLKSLRSTPELIEAVENANKATQELWREREVVASVCKAMGETPDDPMGAVGGFEKLVKTVQVNPETRELKIYSLTDPEVTGIYHLKDNNSDNLGD
ncbi:MAG: hypothetical protein D9V45_03040 [Chloroflexi bacterium]|nr:MAG: hypothetical protein D9V45_03040 [Chloroflexota bacterium]